MLLVLFFCAPTLLAAEGSPGGWGEWPMFRGNAAHTGTTLNSGSSIADADG